MAEWHTQKKRAKDRRRYREARAKGLCGECKKREARGGKTTCQKCFDSRRERMAAYLRKRRSIWKSLKICMRCGQREAMIYRTICGVCSEADTERKAKSRANYAAAS